MAVANCWGFAWLRNKRVVEIVFILFAVSEQWAAKLDFCVCCRLRTNFDLIWCANGISFSIAFIGGLWIFVFRLLSSLSLSLVRVLWSPFLQLTNNLINFIFGVFECRKNNSIQSVQVFWCVFCVCVYVAGWLVGELKGGAKNPIPKPIRSSRWKAKSLPNSNGVWLAGDFGFGSWFRIRIVPRFQAGGYWGWWLNENQGKLKPKLREIKSKFKLPIWKHINTYISSYICI